MSEALWRQRRDFSRFSKKATLKDESPKLTPKQIAIAEIISPIIANADNKIEWNQINDQLSDEQLRSLYHDDAFDGLRKILGITDETIREFKKTGQPQTFPEETIDDITALRRKIMEFINTKVPEDQKYKFDELKEAVQDLREDNNDDTKFKAYWRYVDQPELFMIEQLDHSIINDVVGQDYQILELYIQDLKDEIKAVYNANPPTTKTQRTLTAPFRGIKSEVASPIQQFLKPLYDSIIDNRDPNKFFYEWLKIDKDEMTKLGLQSITRAAENCGFVTENVSPSSEEATASALIFTRGNVRASAKLLINFS